jgi:hypothetical protein
LALLESEALDIVAIGDDVNVVAGDGNRGLRVSWGKENSVQHNYAIDALGQSGEMEYNSCPLYQSLQQNGFAEDVWVLFREQNYGKRLFQQTRGKMSRISIMNGKFYFKAAGFLMDMRNFSLVSKDSSLVLPKIYAMGPPTYGQVAFPQDLSVVTTCAERIVEYIEKEFQPGNSISEENRVRFEKEELEAKSKALKPNAKGFLSANMRDMSKTDFRQHMSFKKM